MTTDISNFSLNLVGSPKVDVKRQYNLIGLLCPRYMNSFCSKGPEYICKGYHIGRPDAGRAWRQSPGKLEEL